MRSYEVAGKWNDEGRCNMCLYSDVLTTFYMTKPIQQTHVQLDFIWFDWISVFVVYIREEEEEERRSEFGDPFIFQFYSESKRKQHNTNTQTKWMKWRLNLTQRSNFRLLNFPSFKPSTISHTPFLLISSHLYVDIRIYIHIPINLSVVILRVSAKLLFPIVYTLYIKTPRLSFLIYPFSS